MKGGKFRGWTAEDHEQLASLWGTGLSTAEIGYRMGRSEQAVRCAAARKNLGPVMRIIVPKPKPKPKKAAYPPGFPKVKPCLGGCGRSVRLKSRNDRRKCQCCHNNHADYSHLEGVAA